MPPVASRLQNRPIRLDVGLLLVGAVLLAIVLALSRLLAVDVGDALTRNTVRLSLAWYVVALCAMMRLQAGDWQATALPGRFARDCWTWALACFLVHLSMAFHYFHHWSHADAFERTRQVSRFGEGIYVSYLFTVLWFADVAWWWLRPRQYAARSAWVDRTLHTFMLFIIFNGAVVYESGPIRWAGLLGYGVLAVARLVTWPRRAATAI